MYTETDTEPTLFQCRHIFTDGRRCASPALRNSSLPTAHEPFCYFHHTTRRPAPAPKTRRARAADARLGSRSTFTLPRPCELSERSGIQLAIGQVLERIASNSLDPRRAGLLLYGLQIASLNLPKDPAPQSLDSTTVTELTLDPVLGPLAPPATLDQSLPKGSAQLLLEKLCYAEATRPLAPENPNPSSLPSLLALADRTPPRCRPSRSGLNPRPLKTLRNNHRERAALRSTLSVNRTIEPGHQPSEQAGASLLKGQREAGRLPARKRHSILFQTAQYQEKCSNHAQKASPPMNLGLLVATSALSLLAAPAQQGPPSANPTYPLRETFVTAAETVIDDALAVDIKADQAHFSGPMQSLKTAEDNLINMAEDDREKNIAESMKDLAFQISSCHIQSLDGADTSRCEAQVAGARNRVLETLNKHKQGGAWVDGPPA
jgi:hypothetical protein